MYVIRADGKQLYGRSGAPPNLPQFLKQQLKVGGMIPTKRQLALMANAADNAGRLYLDDRIDEAVKYVTPYAEVNCFAFPALQLHQLGAKFARHGKTVIAQSAKTLDNDTPTLENALTFLKTKRTYGELPEMNEFVEKTVVNLSRDEELMKLFEQAELLDKADYLQGKALQAAAANAYREVARTYPGTQAAEFAAAKLMSLAQSAGASSAQSTTRKARSLLQVAKALEDKQKTREYAARALEMLPADSPLAAEARRMIAELDQ